MTALMLTQKQVERRLQVSHDTLARWRNAGVGPPWYKQVGRIRYPEDELENWVAEQRRAAK